MGQFSAAAAMVARVRDAIGLSAQPERCDGDQHRSRFNPDEPFPREGRVCYCGATVLKPYTCEACGHEHLCAKAPREPLPIEPRAAWRTMSVRITEPPVNSTPPPPLPPLKSEPPKAPKAASRRRKAGA